MTMGEAFARSLQAIERNRSDEEVARLEAELLYLAEHDPLTGLFNRSRFEEELTRQVAYATRYGAGGAVLVIDLDHFKFVNDTLGHPAGDAVIRAVGETLRSRLRDSDVAARLGGDVFAALLARADRNQALAVANSLLDRFRTEPVVVSDQEVVVTSSIGVVPFDHDTGLGPDDLLVLGDQAMYEAKEAGRNRIAIRNGASAESDPRETRVPIVQRIRETVQRESFLVYAQPIVNLDSQQISQRELLLRLRGRNGEVIAPGPFLAAAERFDLIKEVDRWMVGQAIEMISDARERGEELRLDVNVSAKSLGDPELMKVIVAGLDRTAIDPASLIFEVTETAAITNPQGARRFAVELTSLGCRCALDDFGTGFGSLTHLKQLPVDFIKIDGEFVSHLTTSAADQVLVRAMVEIAHGLGMEAIAEFVRDQETLDTLRGLEADYAQGYFLGRPELVTPRARAAAPR